MSAPTTDPAEQKNAETSRPRPAARTRVLRTAQIYDVRTAEAMPTGDLCVAVMIGDEQCEPHLHGLRAPRARWARIFGEFAAADPEFAALARAHLRG